MLKPVDSSKKVPTTKTKVKKIKKPNCNNENTCPMTSQKPNLRKTFKSPDFKFDTQLILKERQADCIYWKRNAEIDEEMKIIDELFQKELQQEIDVEFCTASPTLGYIIFDHSKYNNIIQVSSDSDISCSQRLLLMSLEENELVANIHFHHLLKAGWLPEMDDIKTILMNWGIDFEGLTNNKPLVKRQINDDEIIKQQNFELVFQFLSICVLNSNNDFTGDDLLTLARIAVIISFDYHCGQMINAIKTLFSVCIEKSLHEGNETAIISFAEEIISQHEEEDVLRMVVHLFLPIKGRVIKKMYCYITFKLFKSLLHQTNNINVFPTSINDWFVQDLVDKNYFKQNQKVLSHVIELLEHVVIVFDLYKDEEKLNNMYDFLHSISRPTKLIDSHKLVNILDQWRLKLFRIHVTRERI